jgi:hypothetical protein
MIAAMGVRAEQQRVLDRGRSDDAAVYDLEARFPRAQLDICPVS